MALESATYIDDLVDTNPAAGDNVSQGDDHIRLLKSTIQASFPAIAGAMTSTHTELNILDGATVSTAELNNGFKIAGDVVQVVNVMDGTSDVSGSTLIPRDNTIPQITEGNEYMTLAITPTSASNKLKIEVTAVLSNSVANNLIMALFNTDEHATNALAATETYLQTAGAIHTISFTHYMTAPVAAETTFRLRAGGELAGTMYFNGNASQKYGGVFASSITITEIQV